MIQEILPFLAYTITLFIAAIIPGPGIAAVVGRAIGSGVRGTMPFIFGLALGDITYLTIAILGLSILAKTFAGLFMIVKILGGLYLLYIAWQFWNAKPQKQEVRKQGIKDTLGSVLGGYTVTMGNPKPIVFYLALVPNVIDLSTVTFSSWLILSIITLLVLFLALTPYVLVVDKAKAILSTKSSLNKLNKLAAIFVGGAGALILAESAWAIRGEKPI